MKVKATGVSIDFPQYNKENEEKEKRSREDFGSMA